MAVSDAEFPGEWAEALRRTARTLPSDDPYAHVFLEFRQDLRVRIDSRGKSERVPTYTTGAMARCSHQAAYRSNPEPSDLESLVQAALGGATWPGERTAPPPAALGIEDNDDPSPRLDDLVARGVRAAGAGAWVSASWVSFDQRVAIARAVGDPLMDRRAGSRLRLEVRIQRSGRQASAVADRVVRRGIEDDIAGMAAAVARRADERLDAAPVADGNVAAVFVKGTGGVLIHEIVGHALEEGGPGAEESLLAAHDAPVASNLVSVVDDPRRGRGAWRIDDEGVEARPTALMRDGRVVGRLTDQGSGALSSGHGRRASYRDPVRPRMGCTFLAPGASRAEDIVASTDRGIFVRRMEAVRNDPATGIALFRVSDADRILGGRIVTPLAPFLLQVNALLALGTLDAIADDLEFDTCIGTCLRDGQPLAVSVGAPTFRIGVVRVYS